MNYELMSDLEISRAVAKALDIYYSEEDDAVYVEPESNPEAFDPCNVWADAGPIITEYQIEIGPYEKRISKHDYLWQWAAKGFNDELFATHTLDGSPTRAAMICLLKIKST